MSEMKMQERMQENKSIGEWMLDDFILSREILFAYIISSGLNTEEPFLDKISAQTFYV